MTHEFKVGDRVEFSTLLNGDEKRGVIVAIDPDAELPLTVRADDDPTGSLPRNRYFHEVKHERTE